MVPGLVMWSEATSPFQGHQTGLRVLPKPVAKREVDAVNLPAPLWKTVFIQRFTVKICTKVATRSCEKLQILQVIEEI